MHSIVSMSRYSLSYMSCIVVVVDTICREFKIKVDIADRFYVTTPGDTAQIFATKIRNPSRSTYIFSKKFLDSHTTVTIFSTRF